MERPAHNPSPAQRGCRNVIMALMLPSLILMIVTAIKGYSLILIGLVPHSMSIFLGLLHIGWDHKKIPIRGWVAFLLDAFAGTIYLAVLLPIWLDNLGSHMNYYYYNNPDALVVAAYTTAFFIANMAIHYYLALTLLVPTFFKVFGTFNIFGGPCNKCRDCPRCSRGDEEQDSPAMGGRQTRIDQGAAYSLLGDHADDETPRPSGETLVRGEENV